MVFNTGSVRKVKITNMINLMKIWKIGIVLVMVCVVFYSCLLSLQFNTNQNVERIFPNGNSKQEYNTNTSLAEMFDNFRNHLDRKLSDVEMKNRKNIIALQNNIVKLQEKMVQLTNIELVEKKNLIEKTNRKIAIDKNKILKDRDITMEELKALKLDLGNVRALPKPDASKMHEKWIVVTSIFAPTEDIKKLASIPGWKLLVVGDRKTPRNWKHKGVVFLSINDQLNMGFETVQYLKYGVYQRKNMGYLYAIQHGAKYIYDTDDDNHPYGGKISTFDDMTQEKSYLVYHGNRKHYNAFEHFGQSTLWPRGFPLDMIDKHPVRNYRRCNNVRPLVQQGVVDGDPDLDAIQRLTRKDTDTKFIVYFDIHAPPVVIPSRAFVPYNTQNTFQHYDAFFSLMLPQTVTFRVNDIWRSFITQRLLWDIGGHLVYLPPNAYQDRTPHNFLSDFYEEEDLYRNTNPLTNYLLEWESPLTNMMERHFDIIKGMYKKDIIGSLDVHLAKAWARDLARIGYKVPIMQKTTMECEKKNVTFTPKEMPTLFNRIGQKTINIVELTKDQAKEVERKRDKEFKDTNQ